MITGELKNKIDGLWDVFASGGLVNPLDVIEQITYLMFIHDLDDTDNLRAKECAMLGLPHKSIFADEVTIGGRSIDGKQLKWSTFRDFPAGKMYSVVQEWVFPFIKNLHSDKDSAYSKYMDDAIFKLPTPLLLDKVVTSLDNIYEMMKESDDADVRGDVYEYLLNKIAQSGLNGQFRTPRHIIRMMVDMMDPKADDVICDPACGTSGFLVAVSEYLKENKKQEVFFNRQNKDHYMNHMFHGFDMDRTMLRIGAMNMMTHGVDNPFIEYRDSLSDQNPDREKYSLILANPPFKGSLDYDIVSVDLLKVCKTKKTELLFLTLFVKMLKVGGRCACIVPDGVLFGSSTAHKAIRKEIIENNRLEAVISMPSGVFKPYAGVSTAILVFTKTGHGGTDKVWFYDMKADGFSLDDKRTAVADNNIPDIIERWNNLEKEADRKRTDQSFFVPKEKITENDYDLSINKYKETEYVPVAYPSTQEIMDGVIKIERSVLKEIKDLKDMLCGESTKQDENYDYREMFDIAREFSETADRAEGNKSIVECGWTRSYIIPEIVNRAFSCELFMKSLLAYEGKKPKRIHKLEELWKCLDNETKEEISTELYTRIELQETSLEELLKNVSNAFEEWRYIFEANAKSVCISFLKEFCIALREICCKKYHNCSWMQLKEML